MKAVEEEADPDGITWAAYHATSEHDPECEPAITAMLPLFKDNSKSIIMMRHCMDVIKVAVQSVNPGQTVVITADQPLYALLKEIQALWPDTHGEDHFVLILGGLHIEMAALKLPGDWLRDAGWVESLVEADVSSPGSAESNLNVSHVTRTRYIHEVSACSLYILLRRAYLKDIEELPAEDQPTFEDWKAEGKKQNPH